MVFHFFISNLESRVVSLNPSTFNYFVYFWITIDSSLTFMKEDTRTIERNE